MRMWPSFTILVALSSLPVLAGTNVVRKIVVDDWSKDTLTGTRVELYCCGTNEVLTIIRDGHDTTIRFAASCTSLTARTRDAKTLVGTGGATYWVSLSDIGADGVFGTITLGQGDGEAGTTLEVLRRDPDGNYGATPQSDLDEINRIASRIRERPPKASKKSQ